MYSICVLLYGDHADLARRCLDSLKRHADWARVQDLRIGLNCVGPETARYVTEEFPRVGGPPVRLYTPGDGRNAYKYPLMRKMLWGDDPGARGSTGAPAEYVMWFDDDSYLLGEDGWWDRLDAEAGQADLLGAVYTLNCGWRPGQREGIRAQPWYAGKDVPTYPRFCTGGWWVARADVLRKWDYPFRELLHNNGDVLLGELCHQQGYRVRNYRRRVAVNADEHGRESRAKRRGGSSPWPWQAGYAYDPGWHEFPCNVVTLDPRNCGA